MESLSLLRPSRPTLLSFAPLTRPFNRFSPLKKCTALSLQGNKLRYRSGFQFHHLSSSVASTQQQNGLRRSLLVKSNIADAAGGSAQPIPESELVPKIRGICFYSVTAVVAIVLFMAMVVVHPLVLLLDQYRRRAHHFIAKIWAALTIALFYKLDIEGLENLPPQKLAAVYVSNHQSFLDIYTLLTLGRSFKFISKRSIFVIPIIGWAMFMMGVIPLARLDSKSQLDCLKRCMDLLRKGASVFFFPEGTRSKDGKLGSFKKGAFSVAAKTEVPVVPITLMGTGKLMPPEKEGILNSGLVKVVIHKPIRGSSADMLSNETRKVIADTLIHHGYEVHE